MNIHNFDFISPNFNYKRLVVIEKEENAFSKVQGMRLIDMNKFDIAGCCPLIGQGSGLVRLILSIIDLFKTINWTPTEETIGEKLKSRQVGQLNPGKAPLTTEQMRNARLARFGGAPKGEEEVPQPSVQHQHNQEQDNRNGAVAEIKRETRQFIFLNIGRALIEIIPLVGQIAMIAYSLLLKYRQETTIQANLKSHPIPPESAQLNGPSHSSKGGKPKMGRIGESSFPELDFGQMLKSVTAAMFPDQNSVAVNYIDTHQTDRIARGAVGNMIAKVI